MFLQHVILLYNSVSLCSREEYCIFDQHSGLVVSNVTSQKEGHPIGVNVSVNCCLHLSALWYSSAMSRVYLASPSVTSGICSSI